MSLKQRTSTSAVLAESLQSASITTLLEAAIFHHLLIIFCVFSVWTSPPVLSHTLWTTCISGIPLLELFLLPFVYLHLVLPHREVFRKLSPNLGQSIYDLLHFHANSTFQPALCITSFFHQCRILAMWQVHFPMFRNICDTFIFFSAMQ